MNIPRLKKITRFDAIKYSALFLLLGFPIYFPLRSLVSSTIPHWYDTAWGLLLGLENHQKIRLIGYEGGMPGIFYGPHWSWMLSLVQLFSKNPVVIAFVVLFIPYFTLIPYLLYKYRSLFGKVIVALLWLIFILKYHHNSTHLWHIHLAPILLLAISYLLINVDWSKKTRQEYLRLGLLGFLSSFLVFIHMSFGSVTSIAAFIFILGSGGYYVFQNRKQKKQVVFQVGSKLASFIAGFVLCSMPFIVFELRHGLQQTKRIIHVLTQAIVYKSASVGMLGMSRSEIWSAFFSLPLDFLQIPKQFTLSFWLGIVFIILVITVKRRWLLTNKEKRLLTWLFLSKTILLGVYLSSKNPIWVYQFMGVEIIYLLGLGFLVKKFKLVKALLLIWVGVLSISTIFNAITSKPLDPMSLPTLRAKRHIVESIYQDANGVPFSAHAQSSAIYTFDYDYLFKWLGNDVYGYEPSEGEDLVYLIIPDANETVKQDFINYKTPGDRYKTEKEWGIASGTVVVKRTQTY